MNEKALDYFLTAYETQNFAQAAKMIPISPQGLLKAIRRLESELNVVLFDGSSGTQIPTEYGIRLYEYAIKHQEEFASLLSELDSIRRTQKGILRIGTCIGIMGILPLSFFDDFHEAYPNISIEHEDIPDYLCDERLRNGIYDLAFTIYPYDTAFETIELFDDHHFLWMANTNPLVEKDTVTIRDLEQLNLHSVGKEYKGHNELYAALEKHGITVGSSVVSGEMDWLHHLAGAKDSVSLTVRHKTRLFEHDATIVAKPFPELPWRFGLSYPNGHTLSSNEMAFVSFCTGKMADYRRDSLAKSTG